MLMLLSVGAASATTYYVNKGHAVNGDGTRDSAATEAGGPGAWNNITSAANADIGAGAVVRVHAGTYAETLWPKYGGSEGNPITYETFGDGDVVLKQAAPVPRYTGLFYSPNKGSTGFVRNVNHLVVRGKPGSLWRFVGNGGADGLVVYAGDDKANGNNFTFQHVTITQCSAGFHLMGDGCKMLDVESFGNTWSGGWFHNCRNIEVRRYKGHNNNRDKGNTDGLSLQDVSYALVEDAELYGQYDGLDVGSQGAAPGCSFVIIRRAKSYSNSNTNFPNSTTVTGPVVFEYCQSWDNHNWGSAVSYEGSRNVQYWNCTFADVGTGINYNSPATTHPSLCVRNSIFALAAGKIAIRGPAAIEADYNRVTAGVKYLGGVAPGADSTVGPVSFVNAAGRDYRLAVDNPAAIDGGAFFMRTADAGTRTALLPVDGDPHTYFWPGDEIQIEGTGLRKVVSMTTRSITLDAPATFNRGKGVHLPWTGVRPDLGALEAPAAR